jgi:hypothetical protein
MDDRTILRTCTNTTTCSASWQGTAISQGTHSISATAVSTLGYAASASTTILKLK